MAEKRCLSLSSKNTEAIHFLKKLKVEQENINHYIKKKHPEIDIKTRKINKFLTIFNAISDSDLGNIKESFRRRFSRYNYNSCNNYFRINY